MHAYSRGAGVREPNRSLRPSGGRARERPLVEPGGPRRIVTENRLATIAPPSMLTIMFNPNPWYPPRALIVSPDGHHLALVLQAKLRGYLPTQKSNRKRSDQNFL